jgi:phosphatidylglycerophosphate synthase
MLDGLHRDRTSRFWQDLARPLARSGLRPNQVTWLGLVLVFFNCAVFYHYRNTLVFGLGLAVAFAFDSLDGAVARLQGTQSRYGGYLDAVADRYQEVAVYLVIGWVTGWWAACFVAVSGSLLVSYNKARTAIEMPISNEDWPDLLERFERVTILCTALVLDSFVPLPAFLGGRPLYLGILIVAVLSHVTAAQRFKRARALLMHDARRER